MEEKLIEQEMYHKAIELIEKRYPTGWGGAAVIYTEDGRFLTSVALETANGGAQLCIEVGAMCEAHKYNVKVTHCLCVVRNEKNSPYKILSPCGICQERLRYWGTDVKVGVTTKENILKFVTLDKMQPYHWTDVYPANELEHFSK